MENRNQVWRVNGSADSPSPRFASAFSILNESGHQARSAGAFPRNLLESSREGWRQRRNDANTEGDPPIDGTQVWTIVSKYKAINCGRMKEKEWVPPGTDINSSFLVGAKLLVN
jgi:hypothetical protein